MPKEFYTEIDIEDMFKRGVMTLSLNDDVVLTELAYEKASRLGMKLVRQTADNPPSAPVRPYLSQPQSASSTTSSSMPNFSIPPQPSVPPPAVSIPPNHDLQKRIREAVIARMGSQIDSNLLDAIIQRVLASTGIK